MSAEEMAQEHCESMGWEFRMGTYWARPLRLGWRCRCSALDDWKVMEIERVEELSGAELARYGQALGASLGCLRLRCGKQGGLRANSCSRCAAGRRDVDGREA
eukprot:8084350-Pyramimonas_sp.AAC.1